MAGCCSGALAPLFVLVCLPIAVLSAACVDICPASLLPLDEECAGITRDGDTFIANNVQELADGPINGEAYLYEKYGFVKAAIQSYATVIGEAPVWIMVSVFNQGTAANAEALYEDPNVGSGDAIGDWTGSGAGRLKLDLLTVTIQFWEECLFGSIVIGSREGDASDRARCLADAIMTTVQMVPAEHASWGDLKTRFR